MEPRDLFALALEVESVGYEVSRSRPVPDELGAAVYVAWDAGYAAAIAYIRGKAEAL